MFTDWMFLPDLVLEHIFKFLSYKVGGGGARLVKGDHNIGPAGESLSWCGLQSVVQSVLEHGHLVTHHSHRLHHVLLAVQHHLQGLRGYYNFTLVPFHPSLATPHYSNWRVLSEYLNETKIAGQS